MKTHLILDEGSVDAAHGVTFHLNQATKHRENPVLLPGKPHQWDSRCVSWPGSVLYSSCDRKFRCWYSAIDVIPLPDRNRLWRPGYAESDDGVHWTKPALGQIEFLGRPTNQIRLDWDFHILSSVFENPSPDAPAERRFGAYWAEYRFAGEKNDWINSRWIKSLAWSGDGVNWKRTGVAYGEKDLADYQDLYQVMHDPTDPDPNSRWKVYGQVYVPRPDGSGWPGIRHIGLAHGAEVEHVEDASQRIVLAPEPGIDEEVHFAVVRKIGDTYMMLFESDRFSHNPIHGDLRLAVSDDGRKFRRVHPCVPLVPTGSKGMWDENLLVTVDPAFLEVGDEIYIYYFGCPNIYTAWPMQYAVTPERCGAFHAPVYLGLATLPRDRFAYARGEGSIVTHPIELTDDGLWLNADGDDLHMEAQGQTGHLGDERRQSVYRKVVWSSKPAPRGPCRLRIALSPNSRLFSYLC